MVCPIKMCSELRINQLLTMYHCIHFTYFNTESIRPNMTQYKPQKLSENPPLLGT